VTGVNDRNDAAVWYPLPTDEQAARAVAEEFRGRFGRAPDGVWAAPGRVNVIGEHVDYNAGLCLPFALPQRTFAALGVRDDDVVRLRSAQMEGDAGDWSARLDEVGPGRVRGWAGYAAGVPWALRQDGLTVPGFDAAVDGHVPLGSGLSSSAALECAVAVALDELAGLGLGGDDAGRARLAAACMRAENEVAGAPTGGLDQAASLRCSSGSALLLDCRDFAVRQVPFDLAGAGLELLVMDTRAHHALVDGQYGSRREACDRLCELLGVATLRDVPADGLDEALARVSAAVTDPAEGEELRRRLRHVVSEIDRVARVVELLEADGLDRIGPLLDASHRSLRDDYEVSCAELDVACRVAVDAGALGARMTGGGFGGSAIALVRSTQAPAVANAVAAAFASSGFGAPAFLRATPSGPASRVA
jgi:galactokinase